MVTAGLALALVLGGAYQLLSVAARDTFTARSAYPSVIRLVISDEAGAVRLADAPAGSPVRVIEHVTRGLSAPRRRADLRPGGTLRLSARCPAIFDSECRVDYEVAVPPETSLQIGTSAGDVVARDLTSARPVELTASAGAVRADGVRAPSVRLTSTAGDVVARAIYSPVIEAESTAGDVAVQAIAPLRRLSALSTAGDVALTVPDAVYAVDVQTLSNSNQDLAVRQDPSSPRLIKAQSTAGGVSIRTGP